MDSDLWSLVKGVKERRHGATEEFVSRTLPKFLAHFENRDKNLEAFYQRLGAGLTNLRPKDDFWSWCKQIEPGLSVASDAGLEASKTDLAKRGLQTGLESKPLAPSIRRLLVRLMLSLWLPFALYFFAAQQLVLFETSPLYLAEYIVAAGCWATLCSLLFSPFSAAFRSLMRQKAAKASAAVLALFLTFVLPFLTCGLILPLLKISMRSPMDWQAEFSGPIQHLMQLSAYSLWDQIGLAQVFTALAFFFMVLWPLCALVKREPGVLNRASKAWRMVLSLPLLFLVLQGLYLDARTLHKGWALEPSLLEFVVQTEGADFTLSFVDLNQIAQKVGTLPTPEQRCQAWLDLYPDLWQQKEWWSTARFREMVKLSDGVLWQSASPPSRVELEVLVRSSFLINVPYKLQRLEKVELEPEEWNDLIELARLAVTVRFEEMGLSTRVEQLVVAKVLELRSGDFYFPTWQACQQRAHLNRLWAVLSDKESTQTDIQQTLANGVLFYDWQNFYPKKPAQGQTRTLLLAIEVKRLLSQGQVPKSLKDLPEATRALLQSDDSLELEVTEDTILIRDGRKEIVYKIGREEQ